MFMHPQMPCYAFAVVFFFGAIELLLAGKRTLALLVNLEPHESQPLGDTRIYDPARVGGPAFTPN